jgi:hypothetical protein
MIDPEYIEYPLIPLDYDVTEEFLHRHGMDIPDYYIDMSPFSPATKDHIIANRKRKKAKQEKWQREAEQRARMREDLRLEQERTEKLEREANWAQIVKDRNNVSPEAERRYQSYIKKAKENRERKWLEKEKKLSETYLEATRRSAELWLKPGPSVIQMYKKKGVSPEKLQERLNEIAANKMDSLNEY